MLLWCAQRFPGDETWFREHLSKPEEVRVDGNGTLRLHVATEGDLDAVIAAIAEHTKP